MPVDISKFKGVTLQDIEEEFKRRGMQVPGQQAQATQPSTQQPTMAGIDINSLLKRAQPNIGQVIGDALVSAGGGTPTSRTDSGLDLSKLYAQEAIKSQFEDPTVRQLRQAELDALKAPPPTGFVRVGKQTLLDPEYIKPKEQKEMEEAAEAKQYQEDVLRESAQSNLETIKKVKEGAKYFGPLGEVPTIAAPSTYLQGEYGPRKQREANVEKLLSQKVIDVMSEMRKASKTGASGFGQLTEKELAVLRSASTALNKGLAPADAIYYLDEMENIHKMVLGGSQPQGQAVAGQVEDFSQMSDDDLRRIAAGGQ